MSSGACIHKSVLQTHVHSFGSATFSSWMFFCHFPSAWPVFPTPGCVAGPMHTSMEVHKHSTVMTHSDKPWRAPIYVQGLSVTHGSRRNHICTFAAGASNDRTLYVYHCPCGHYKDVLLTVYGCFHHLYHAVIQ